MAKKEDVLWLGPSQSPFKDLESDGGLASTVAAAGISAVGEAVVLVYKVWAPHSCTAGEIAAELLGTVSSLAYGWCAVLSQGLAP